MGESQNGIEYELGIFEELTLYIAIYDLATEITGDGTTRYLAEVSKENATEGEAEANPSWTQDLCLDLPYEVAILSLYAELHWAMKITGAGTGYAKWQISRDGGSTWFDITDNVDEAGVVYADKARIGATLAIDGINGGSCPLSIRLCAWVVGESSVEVKVREDSYIKLLIRKSPQPT